MGTNMCHECYIPHPRRHHSAFPFLIIHHTQHKKVKRCCHKSADVDWYIRVGQKSVVQTKLLFCVLTRYTIVRPPLKKWLQFISYLLFSHQTSIKNKVKCGYLLSWWKRHFSFHCEQVTILWCTLRRHYQ